MVQQDVAMTQPNAIERLRRAFIEIAPRSDELAWHEAAGLRGFVYAAVDELKAANVRPEQVIVAVKTLAGDAGIRFVRHGIVELMTTWCIGRYFEGVEPLIAPRPDRRASRPGERSRR
jgi:hypothetical protein